MDAITGAQRINTLATTARRTFFMDNQKLMNLGDKTKPWITSLAVTGDGRVVMADYKNKAVKVVGVGSSASISAMILGVAPGGLTVCHDGRVAVTSDSDYIIRLIDVTGTPRFVGQFKTGRKYWGVGCGGSDSTLFVSCVKDKDGPAQLDIITREGTLVRKVVDSKTLPGLTSPDYLCVVGGEVLLSDFYAHCVWRVDVATGNLLAKYTHPALECPLQVTTDRAGNVYVASRSGRCVLVIGRDEQWQTLLNAQEHGEGEYDRPRCVALTGSRLTVGWSGDLQSVLIEYELA